MFRNDNLHNIYKSFIAILLGQGSAADQNFIIRRIKRFTKRMIP